MKGEKIKLNKNKLSSMGMSPTINYIYYYHFDIRYNQLSPIIKDIQMSSQLIQLIKKYQLSDLIFIKGNNTYTIESIFYFNYRKMIDFYIKVLDFIETDYFTNLSYFIYKTKPSSKEFIVNLAIFNEDENSSKISIEIILFNNSTIDKKILNIIYNEFNIYFGYLIEAIKKNKMQSFSFYSGIVKNEFYVLAQILQNTKLIEYIINGEFKESQKETKNINNQKDKSYIHLNQKYIVFLKKKKDINDWLMKNNIAFQIKIIKLKEDNLIIQYKVTFNDKEKEIINDNNSINNIVTIFIRKITTNSSFILIKCVWDFSLDKNLINSIKNFIKKCFHNIEKLCKTANKY